MSIQAKQSLIKDITRDIDVYLPKVESDRVINTINDNLVNYDVEEVTGAYNSATDDLLIAFLEAKEIEGRSPKTINRYRYMLEKSLNAIGVQISKITVFHLRSYLMEEKRRGLSDPSLEGLRSILSSFFGWLFKEGLIQINPMANIGTIKCTKEVKEPFTTLELELIKQACQTNRERAIVAFLRATGCRIGEVCRLNRTDVDLKNMECKVLGKGDKERIVYIDSVTAMELERYFSERTDDDPCLFYGLRGRMKEGGIRAMLKEIEKRCGVANIHPHRFRRTLATSLINRGMPIQEVAYLLGHDKLDTTMKYVYIEGRNVKNAYNKFI